MAFNIVQEIRKKSRERWRETLWEKTTDLRIWIQENGEVAFLVAIVLGICLASFFKFFAFVVAIAVIVAFGIYLVSMPESELSVSQYQNEGHQREATNTKDPVDDSQSDSNNGHDSKSVPGTESEENSKLH